MDSRRKARWIRRLEKATFNPLFLRLVRAGRASPYAIIETTGRRTGLPRQVPVANALDGDTFWVVAENPTGQPHPLSWSSTVVAAPDAMRVAARGTSGLQRRCGSASAVVT